MKKLLALVMAVMMLLLLAACTKNPETPSTSAPSEESTAPTSESASEPTVEEDPYAGLNKDIYVDKEWTILNAKHEKEVTITMWIPNSATSTMGTAIQALADKFNAEQKEKYPGKNISVVIEFQDKSGTLNEKLQAAILAGNNPVISAIGVSSVPLYEARALDLRQVFTYDELQQQSQGMMQYSLYNGKYLLNPYFPSASNIIIYNKTLLESKGVTIPDVETLLADPDASDWTWDAFRSAAKAVTDEANGIYGFATNSLDPVGMMFQQGGALYNSSVTELKFVGDERFAKGLEFWRSGHRGLYAQPQFPLQPRNGDRFRVLRAEGRHDLHDLLQHCQVHRGSEECRLRDRRTALPQADAVLYKSGRFRYHYSGQQAC